MDKNLKYYQFTKENQHLERKSARKKPLDIVKHLVAFANAEGGVLVIGIEDNGDITGFKDSNAHPSDKFIDIAFTELQETPIIIKHHFISTTNVNNEDDCILILNIEPSNNRVIKSYDNYVYLRHSDESRKLGYEQVFQLQYDRGQRFFEDETLKGSSISDIDESIINSYKKIMDSSLSTQEILEARNFLIDGELTAAGILLFGKNPTKYFPQARLRFIKYDGSQAQVGRDLNIVKEKSFDSAIPTIIQESKEFILTQLREFQYLDDNGIFKKMPEYPEFAWFEGIVNAVTHRDYSIRGEHIKVIMFDDRLEIHSPGKLPNIVTIENIRYQRYSRNPRIARILTEFGWVKEMNEGVKRIYTEMENFFLKSPTYSEPGNNVLLVLENNIINRHLRIEDSIAKMIKSEVFIKLSDDEKAILSHTFVYNSITTKEATKLLNRSRQYVRNLFKNLVGLDLLKWNGSNPQDPTQYYTLNT